jgi:hypothetical protein
MRNAAQIRLAYARSASLGTNQVLEIEAYWNAVLNTYKGTVARERIHQLGDKKLAGIFDWWFNRERDLSVCNFSQYASKLEALTHQLIWVHMEWETLDPETDRDMMEHLIDKADDLLQKPILPNKTVDTLLKQWLINKNSFYYYKFYDFNLPPGHRRTYPDAWGVALNVPPKYKTEKSIGKTSATTRRATEESEDWPYKFQD